MLLIEVLKILLMVVIDSLHCSFGRDPEISSVSLFENDIHAKAIAENKIRSKKLMVIFRIKEKALHYDAQRLFFHKVFQGNNV